MLVTTLRGLRDDLDPHREEFRHPRPLVRPGDTGKLEAIQHSILLHSQHRRPGTFSLSRIEKKP